MSESPYLTIPEVAVELQMTTSGVYKLIQRDKLPVVRHSERGTRVTRWALDAYRRRLNGEGPNRERPRAPVDRAGLRKQFEEETGLTPEQWVARWKEERIEDSAENTSRLVRALGLRDERKTEVVEVEKEEQDRQLVGTNADFERLGADEDGWADFKAETAEWDTTSSDSAGTA